MTGLPLDMMGDPIQMIKQVLPKTVTVTFTFAIVADPQDTTKEAFAIILRENK